MAKSKIHTSLLGCKVRFKTRSEVLGIDDDHLKDLGKTREQYDLENSRFGDKLSPKVLGGKEGEIVNVFLLNGEVGYTVRVDGDLIEASNFEIKVLKDKEE